MRIRRLLGGVSHLPLMIETGDDTSEGAGGPGAAAVAPDDDHEAGSAAAAAAATREADDADASGEPAPEPEKKPARVPWQVKRIDKLTAEAREAQEAREAAERRAQEAERRAQAYEALYGKDGGAAPAAGDAPAPAGRTYTEKDVQAEAVRIANVRQLNERIDRVFDDGLKSKGADWNTRVSTAAAAFGADLQQRPDFFEALTALPNPDEVYYALAGDLDHFAEVLAMGPAQMGIALATMATKGGPKSPSVSRVPAPIAPLDASAPEEVPLDKADMSDYVKIREKQQAERRAARGY